MIYFGLFFLMLLWAECHGGSELVYRRKKYKNIEILVFVGIFVLIGFRDKRIGTDTITYVYQFLGAPKDFTRIQGFSKDSLEPLYTVLLILCRQISDNYTVFLSVFGFPIAFCFTWLIKKYSTDYFISVLLFIMLGVMGFCMAGIRQSVAIAFTMIAYHFVYERKIIPFLCFGLIAIGFHNTAWIFLLVYPLMQLSVGWYHWVAVAIAFVLGITKNDVVLQISNYFAIQERYIVTELPDEGLNYTMFFIQIVLVFFCYLYKERVIQENKKNRILYHLVFIGLIFQSFVPIKGEFFRVSMYYSIYLCLLVPRTIKVLPNAGNRRLVYFGFIGAVCFYLFCLSSNIMQGYKMFF